jgi:hypothetical protein
MSQEELKVPADCLCYHVSCLAIPEPSDLVKAIPYKHPENSNWHFKESNQEIYPGRTRVLINKDRKKEVEEWFQNKDVKFILSDKLVESFCERR